MPLSASAERRILVWRSEVAASACDDTASSAASSTGSSSDAAASIQRSSSSTHKRGNSIGRFARRLVRRLSGAKGDPNDVTGHWADQPAPQTAMYRVPLPPADGNDDDEVLDSSSNNGKSPAGGGLKTKQERLERAARLLNKQ